MFMGKRVFEDVDEKTFQYIKRCKNDNGFVDCHKLFKKISVGDTIIFSCKNNFDFLDKDNQIVPKIDRIDIL